MNLSSLNPFRLFRGAKEVTTQTRRGGYMVSARASEPEGAYTSIFSEWVAREINPHLFEAIREAVGPIDGAINRLVTLDGIIRVEGKNARLVREIEDWMENVRVNDLENGFQSFYRSQGNELYEQGFTVGEPVVDGGDVAALRVADSKGIIFRRAEGGGLETWYRPPAPQSGRRDGTDQIERVLRNTYRSHNVLNMLNQADYRKLDSGLLVYACFNPEADGPYGTSLLRSTEFDARVLLVMKNSLYRVWERFGDPSFVVNYKTNARVSSTELETRRKSLADNLASVLSIKRSGNSGDFVNAVGKDDVVEVKVLGSDGQVLEIETPARHVLENIVSKTGLPSWMLSFHWSTAERLAERQGELCLQESRTRFATRKPALKNVIALMLRARGFTWKPGDWDIVQELPNLQDLVAKAQAGFLEAQTQFMLRNGGQAPATQPAAGGQDPGAQDGPKLLEVGMDGKFRFPAVETTYGQRAHGPGCGCKDATQGEEYPEDRDNLMALERRAEGALLKAWGALQGKVLEALGVAGGKATKAPTFTFDRELVYSVLRDLEEEFVQQAAGEESVYVRSVFDAWLRGMANSAAELGADAIVEAATRETVRAATARQGMDMVRDIAIRALRDDIIQDLEQGAYDGQNPNDVARALEQRFGSHDYDFTRLARSEIAAAQAQGKMDQYAEMEITDYDWVAAGNSCPICIGMAQSGPYKVGTGPTPMRDSHPNCRCTVAARVD